MHVGRRAQDPGRLPLPPIEVVELIDEEPQEATPTALQPIHGFLGRLAARLTRAGRKDRYVLDGRQLPAEILGDRPDFALLELDEGQRPVLQVLPGMAGELRIGVSCMRVEEILADPALRAPDGRSARLPLANGARLRIDCGRRAFVARVGGPPLLGPALHPTQRSATRLAQTSA